VEYKIIIKPSAQRELDKLPTLEVERIAKRLRGLAINPRPIGIQKLNNEEGYRIRVGNYRVLFEIEDVIRIVSIYRIKHRKDVYRY